MTLRPDDEVVHCRPNADHGHPDEARTATLGWLRFLDVVYSAKLVDELRGSPELQATRAAWALVHEGVNREEASRLKPGCWGVMRMIENRDLLWGEVE